MNLRVVKAVRGRWVPHKKHDIVAAPKPAAGLNGEPLTLDWYRSPSSRIFVVVSGLDMIEF